MKIALALTLALTACSQDCPTYAVKEWTRTEQKQILAEEKKLGPDSILVGVMENYAKLRREVR